LKNVKKRKKIGYKDEDGTIPNNEAEWNPKIDRG
jgi:hypothetical protein